jgi:hypothetical protein
MGLCWFLDTRSGGARHATYAHWVLQASLWAASEHLQAIRAAASIARCYSGDLTPTTHKAEE